jgi:protein involved in polysaccharide export with SLBB domain
VSIVGSAATAGTVELRDGYRITEVLAAAGGIQGEYREIKATLTRGRQRPVLIDLHAAVSRPSSAANRRVLPGDVLTLIAIEAPRVVISGAVGRPGVYKMRRSPQAGAPELPLQPKVSDAIVAAGGVQGRVGSVKGTITRAGQQTVQINVSQVTSQPASAANVRLRAGDVLTFTVVEPSRITITGDVAKPNIYELHYSPSPNAYELPLQPRLSDAVVAAGGLQRVGAAVLTATETVNGAESAPDTEQYEGTVTRKNQKITLNVAEALRNPNSAANIRLLPNDFVSLRAIPPLNIVIDGNTFVQRSGSLQVSRGSRVFDVIAQAGGLMLPPEKMEANIRRGGQIIPVDLKRVLLSPDAAANVELRNNDIVQLREPPIIRVQAAGSFQQTWCVADRP